MKNQNSLSYLLKELHFGRQHMMFVRSVKPSAGIVYIGLSSPRRTAVVSKQTYEKLKDCLMKK